MHSNSRNNYQDVDYNSVTMADVFIGMWRRKILMLIIIAIGVAGTMVFLAKAVTKYRAEAKLIIDHNENALAKLSSVTETQSKIDNIEVSSQVHVIKSYDAVKQVMDHFNIHQMGEFNKGGKTLSNFMDKLSVYVINGTRVISINFQSEKPELTALIPNKLMEIYIGSGRQRKFSSMQKTSKWLLGEIEKLRKDAIDADLAVERFRTQKGLYRSHNVPKDSIATLSSQELSGITDQIMQAQVQRAEARERAQAIKDMLKSQNGIEGSSEVLKSNIIQTLRTQQVELNRKIADLSITYLPSHPKIQSLQAEIAGINRQINIEARKIISSLEEQERIAGKKVKFLEAKISSLKKVAKNNGQDSVRLRALEMEAKAKKSQLEIFMRRYEEAVARQELLFQPSSARIVSRAIVPTEPYFPKKGPIMAMGVGGAIAFAALIAFILEIFSTQKSAGVSRRADMVTNVQNKQVNYADNSEVVNQPINKHKSSGEGIASGLVTEQTNIGIRENMEQTILHKDNPAQNRNSEKKFIKNNDYSLNTQNENMQKTRNNASTSNSLPSDIAEINFGNKSPGDAALDLILDKDSQYYKSISKIVTGLENKTNSDSAKKISIIPLSTIDIGFAHTASLARVLAMSGKKTLFIDLNFLNPQIPNSFAVTPGVGMAELLAGQVNFADVMVRDQASGLHFIMAGINTALAPTLLKSERLEAVLRIFDSEYDFIILSVPNISDFDSGIYVSQQTDLTVLLTENSARYVEYANQMEGYLHHNKVSSLKLISYQSDNKASYANDLQAG